MDAKKVVTSSSFGDFASGAGEAETHDAFLQMSLYAEALREIEKKQSDHSEDYLEVEVFPYTDDESNVGANRLAVLVSFVQDYRDHDRLLDRKVLETLVGFISTLEFAHVVNDVTVNGLQWRDGIIENFQMD